MVDRLTPPQLRLDALIDRQGVELAAIGREAILAATKAFPTANRIVDGEGGLLKVHFCPGTALSEAFVAVAFHAYWVAYEFPYGKRMFDLDELLRGGPGPVRYYVIEGPGDVGDYEIAELLRDARDRALRPPNPENRAALLFQTDLDARR